MISSKIKVSVFLPNLKIVFSNYWLNVIILENITERNNFLEFSNNNKVMTRPIWKLMNKLEMFKNTFTYEMKNSEWFEDRVVNIPSSVIVKYKQNIF